MMSSDISVLVMKLRLKLMRYNLYVNKCNLHITYEMSSYGLKI